jgi:antitoxin (DNA-binding transcriptional repressor) of toxin-antitoxin stability system
MIHFAVKTASIRDLRTRFPKIRRMLEQEGQLVVTDRGRPVILLQPYSERAAPHGTRVDYFARLQRRMPKPFTAAARRALDEADRGER